MTATKPANEPSNTSDREIRLTRTINAPRDLVFKAWTDPMHIAQWWGPNGFTTTIHSMDVRPGGEWHFVMHGPDGRDYKNRIIYNEIVKLERITYNHMREDADDKVQFQATVTFASDSGDAKTKVTLHMIFPTEAIREHVVKEYGAIEGGNQTLARLGNYVPNMPGRNAEQSAGAQQPGTNFKPAAAGKREFTLTRVFDAPRSLVFQAWTQPEHLKRWWGVGGCTIGTCELDLRVGGKFHYCMQMPNGMDLWGIFVYREIAPPERLIFANSISDPQGNIARHPFSPKWPLEILNTLTLTEQSGKTTLTFHAIPINATEEELQAFDGGMVFMEQGFASTLNQLATYLAEKRS
jgi:uncharacterized protein YndB with AHSA1/START domain